MRGSLANNKHSNIISTISASYLYYLMIKLIKHAFYFRKRKHIPIVCGPLNLTTVNGMSMKEVRTLGCKLLISVLEWNFITVPLRGPRLLPAHSLESKLGRYSEKEAVAKTLQWSAFKNINVLSYSLR